MGYFGAKILVEVVGIWGCFGPGFLFPRLFVAFKESLLRESVGHSLAVFAFNVDQDDIAFLLGTPWVAQLGRHARGLEEPWEARHVRETI